MCERFYLSSPNIGSPQTSLTVLIAGEVQGVLCADVLASVCPGLDLVEESRGGSLQ